MIRILILGMLLIACTAREYHPQSGGYYSATDTAQAISASAGDSDDPSDEPTEVARSRMQDITEDHFASGRTDVAAMPVFIVGAPGVSALPAGLEYVGGTMTVLRSSVITGSSVGAALPSIGARAVQLDSIGSYAAAVIARETAPWYARHFGFAATKRGMTAASKFFRRLADKYGEWFLANRSAIEGMAEGQAKEQLIWTGHLLREISDELLRIAPK